jgi:hypothetical protein
MKSWATAIVLGTISAVAIAATYMRSPESDFVGAIMDYNLTFYYPLILVAFVCWVTALCFYRFHSTVCIQINDENHASDRLFASVYL